MLLEQAVDTVTHGVRAGRTSGLGNIVVASEAQAPDITAARGGLLRGYMEGTHSEMSSTLWEEFEGGLEFPQHRREWNRGYPSRPCLF